MKTGIERTGAAFGDVVSGRMLNHGGQNVFQDDGLSGIEIFIATINTNQLAPNCGHVKISSVFQTGVFTGADAEDGNRDRVGIVRFEIVTKRDHHRLHSGLIFKRGISLKAHIMMLGVKLDSVVRILRNELHHVILQIKDLGDDKILDVVINLGSLVDGVSRLDDFDVGFCMNSFCTDRCGLDFEDRLRGFLGACSFLGTCCFAGVLILLDGGFLMSLCLCGVDVGGLCVQLNTEAGVGLGSRRGAERKIEGNEQKQEKHHVSGNEEDALSCGRLVVRTEKMGLRGMIRSGFHFFSPFLKKI